MKSKLMIALVVLALAFGMVFTACDDGSLPKIKDGDHETTLDIYTFGVPNGHGNGVITPKAVKFVNKRFVKATYDGLADDDAKAEYIKAYGPETFSLGDIVKWATGTEYPYKGKDTDSGYPFTGPDFVYQ